MYRKKIIFNINSIFLVIFLITINGCFYDIPNNIEIDISNKTIPPLFELEIIHNTRQIILTQEQPWENQALHYFNVIKNDSLWQMWYMSSGKEVFNDYFGALNYAYSFDGEHWIKSLLNNQPIVEQFVNYEANKYRMIGVINIDGNYSTNIFESINGKDWINKKSLYNKSYDTQFSVITINNKYYIYQRVWHNGLRAVGRSIIDKNYNIIENPKIMLISNDNDFPHIYNNAASKVDNNILLFPTLYNSDNDKIKITVGFEFENQLYLTDTDITEDLYFGEDVKWGVVSPGLIPTGEHKTYWLYYKGNSSSHNNVRIDPNNVAKYYRIKIRLTQKDEA